MGGGIFIVVVIVLFGTKLFVGLFFGGIKFFDVQIYYCSKFMGIRLFGGRSILLVHKSFWGKQFGEATLFETQNF